MCYRTRANDLCCFRIVFVLQGAALFSLFSSLQPVTMSQLASAVQALAGGARALPIRGQNGASCPQIGPQPALRSAALLSQATAAEPSIRGQNGAICPQIGPQPAHRSAGLLAQATAAEPMTYKAAGVDINAGAELVRRIKKMNPSVGGFSGLFPFGGSPHANKPRDSNCVLWSHDLGHSSHTALCVSHNAGSASCR